MWSAMEPRRSVHLEHTCQKVVSKNARGDILLENDHFASLATGETAMVSLIGSVLDNPSKAYVFSDSGLCLGGGAMLVFSGKFKFKWNENIVETEDETPQKASTLNSSTANSTSILVSLPHSCQRRANSTSRLLSTTSARNAFFHRIIFMAMNKLKATDKPHKNDDLRIQQAQEVCDHAAPFR